MTEWQLAVVQEATREVAVWGVPITEQLKDRAMEYFEKRLQRDHGGQLTQQARRRRRWLQGTETCEEWFRS